MALPCYYTYQNEKGEWETSDYTTLRAKLADGWLDKLVENGDIKLKEAENEQGMVGKTTVGTQQGATSKPVKASEIISNLSKKLNLPIRIGKVRWGERIGVFKKHEEVARLKEANDLGTTAHEVAHYIDKKYFGTDSKRFSRWGKELKDLDYDQTKRRSNEGFAEFIRHFLTGDDAQSVAPEFYKHFTEEFLPANKELQTTLMDAKTSIDAWRSQGAKNRVLSQIDFTGQKQPKTLKESFEDIWLGYRTKMTDQLAPLKFVVDKITEGKREQLRPSEDPYEIAFSVQKTSAAKARQFILGESFDAGLTNTGKSLKDVVKPLYNDIENALAYAYAKHAKSLLERGVNPGISLQDAEYVLKNHYKPEYETFSQELTEFSNRVVDYMVDAGALSTEAANKMREANPFYIPLKRSFIDEPAIKGGKSKGLADLSSPIKKIKGSGREIVNPLESIIDQTEKIISISDKTRVVRALVELQGKYPGKGKYIEKVAPPIQEKMTELDNIKKQIEQVGGDLSEADLESIITLFSQGESYFGKDNIVSILKDGKREFYQVDKRLFESMKGLDKYTLPPFMDLIFGQPSRLQRLGATGINPGFSLITNPLRDIQTFMLQSEYLNFRPDKVFKAIYEELMGKSEYSKEFKRGGGEMAQPLGIDRKMLQNTVNEVLANDVKSKALNIVKHPIEAIRRILSFTESGTRLAEFEAVMDKYKPKIEQAEKDGDLVEAKKLREDAAIEASNAASEVTVNFRRAGTYGQIINQFVPFFNPNVQGLSKMGRTIYEHPIRSGFRAFATLTAPTIALWLLNKDEDWYKELPLWRKYGFWNFAVGDKIVSLPRPFEWGWLFSSVPEGIANSLYQDNPKHFEYATQQALQGMVPPLIPGVVKPAMEVYFNWDIFRGREIVPKTQQALEPREQYNLASSWVAKNVGDILNVSPEKLDHLLSGYTGGLSNNIISSLDKEKKEAADIPVVGRLFVRDWSVGMGGQSVQELYNAYDKSNKLKATADRRRKNGLKDNLTEEEKKYILNNKELNKTVKKLTLLKKKERDINKLDIDDGVKKQINKSIGDAAVYMARRATSFLQSEKERKSVKKPAIDLRALRNIKNTHKIKE